MPSFLYYLENKTLVDLTNMNINSMKQNRHFFLIFVKINIWCDAIAIILIHHYLRIVCLLFEKGMI